MTSTGSVLSTCRTFANIVRNPYLTAFLYMILATPGFASMPKFTNYSSISMRQIRSIKSTGIDLAVDRSIPNEVGMVFKSKTSSNLLWRPLLFQKLIFYKLT